MDHLLNIDLTTLVRTVGYPGLFAAVFLESGVFFGFFLPGSSMLFTAGLLASKGFFNIWILMPLLFVAAVLGDNTGYWFGKKVGAPLLERNTRWFRHEYLVQAKDFYDRHGMQAVLLARFVPIVRTFAPIVAGMAGMNYRTFIMYNVAGALIWAAGLTFGGYYLVARIPFFEKYFSYVILTIIIVSVMPLLWHAIRWQLGKDEEQLSLKENQN